MTKREQILAALHVLLVGAGLPVVRNAPLGELPSGEFWRLDDGGIEPGDAFFNPPIYEFTATPVLMIVIVGDGITPIDAVLDARIALADAVFAGVTDLGGLITAIRPQPADYAPKELWGHAAMKGCEMPIEIDYWSDRSVG